MTVNTVHTEPTSDAAPPAGGLDCALERARNLFGPEHVMTAYSQRGIEEIRINTTGAPTGWLKMASPAALIGLIADHERNAA